MAAVQQTIDNLLGGVSTQPDFKKLINQVSQATNALIDPTFGLTKRPGSMFVFDFGSKADFEKARFFFYNRDGVEDYIGSINQNKVDVFRSDGSATATVTVQGNATDYLTSDNFKDYRTITIQDNIIIVNKTVTPAMLPAPTFTEKLVGTIVVRGVEYGSEYTVTINGKTTTPYKTRNGEDTTSNVTFESRDNIAANLKTAIDNLNIAGLTVTQIDGELELSSSTPFTLSAIGGQTNEALGYFQDSVRNISLVPNKSVDGRVVKIENTTADNDDYYIKYVAADEAWEECLKPGISKGLDPTTMPIELISTGVNQFILRPINWEKRLVGDDVTNPEPSFVGQKINNVFFTNNRLSFLAGPNVIMSRISDYYNFFAKSATTGVDDDPIDLNCNSVLPTKLVHALPTAQGVILYSNRQQFLLSAGELTFTPKTTFIRQIANYEVDEDVEPVDLGTYQIFVQKTSGYTRVMAMLIPDVNQPPQVVDISKNVAEWIPVDIDFLLASPVNEFIVLSSRLSNELYFYRKYNTGQEEVMQSWFKWQIPGNPLITVIPDDIIYVVSTQTNKTGLSAIFLDKAFTFRNSILQPIISSDDNTWDNPHLDFYSKATLGTWDKPNRKMKVYVPFEHVPGLEPLVVTAEEVSLPIYKYSHPTNDTLGWYIECNKDANGDLIYGQDATGYYFEVPVDLTKITAPIYVGYKFNFEIEFPELYFKQENQADYTSYLNISRIKFAVGLTGALGFKLHTRGRDDWYDIQPVVESDYYTANNGPLKSRYFFTVPIHQKSMNFKIKAFSDLPYPVSLNLMTWEGIYSPRFYRRV